MNYNDNMLASFFVREPDFHCGRYKDLAKLIVYLVNHYGTTNRRDTTLGVCIQSRDKYIKKLGVWASLNLICDILASSDSENMTEQQIENRKQILEEIQ